MARVFLCLIFFLTFLILPKSAHAIIFLPALILVPVAKIIAVIIAGFSVPAMGMGALFSKISKKPLLKTIFIAIFILIFISILIGIVLKLVNPLRPII